MNDGTKLLASIVTLPPNDTGEPFIVMLELVRLPFAILLSVLLEPLMVLFVSTCAVERSAVTVVSMDTVTVPLLPPPVRPVPAVTPSISPTPSM